ncbi:SubName: Full=Uncharacterized protein {ECO:0000313/EMBL:CCA69282.1} [Serendipita indica DSM 11827]|uniref:Uncharacterized protein n=1 Tax=Serendipita indica (strain DSM 11827) TaxID=1109443 RepID=G4TD72_SERID|nr:SubName: Full=Uncharacterized protein {ECO:0000313/EMBL:CCA69282.1} [Serendipita indica DSM 11827]CCA69282.1 hypothetical protein PIIN_03181 [Serendipita indica DSM 11827]
MSETDALQQALGAFQSLHANASPALGDVLSAYRLKGDGDREMLLAVLNAKAAEDQRAAAVAQLHQSILQAAYTNAMLRVAQQQQPQQSLSQQQQSHYHPYASPRSEPSPRMQLHERPAKRRRDSSSTNTTTSASISSPPLSNNGTLGGTRLPPIMSISSLTSPAHSNKSMYRMDVEESHRPHKQQQQRPENPRTFSYPHSPPSTGSDSETRRSLERLSAERSTS